MPISFNSCHLYFYGLELVTINIALFLNNLSLKENWFHRDVHEERTYFPDVWYIHCIGYRSHQCHLDCWTEIWPCLKYSTEQKCVKTENMIRTLLFQLGNVSSVSLQYQQVLNFSVVITSQHAFLMVWLMFLSLFTSFIFVNTYLEVFGTLPIFSYITNC